MNFAKLNKAELIAEVERLRSQEAAAPAMAAPPRPLENIGRYRRREDGRPVPDGFVGRLQEFVTQTPMGGYGRAIAENLGATPEVALLLERGGAGMAYGVGALTALAAVADLVEDGQTPGVLPMGTTVVTG